MMGAAMGLGMIFGPALGGLLSVYGLSAPFLFGALLGAVNLVFVLVFLREPPRQAVVRPARPRASQTRQLADRAQRPPGLLLRPDRLVSFAMANLQSTFALFSQAAPRASPPPTWA